MIDDIIGAHKHARKPGKRVLVLPGDVDFGLGRIYR